VTSYSLDKQKVSLPGGLEGQTDLLLISFKPEQQADIDSWLPAAQALQHASFQFRYYQLPVAERENFVFRWWESSSMRSDQTDPETWHWIVPLWVDRKSFFADLQIPNEKQVVILLVDRQGHILWRASGPMSADTRADVYKRQALVGLSELKQRGHGWFRSGKLIVRVGEPIPFDPNDSPEQITNRLYETLKSMLEKG